MASLVNVDSEEDLTQSLEVAMDKYPDTYAVLVRRHGIYVWGDNVHKAKTQAERYLMPTPDRTNNNLLTSESLDYIFQLAVRMRDLGLPWTN